MTSVIFLILLLLLNAAGQLFYKAFALNRKRILLAFSLIAFLLVPYFTYEALKGLSIDVVYMATSLTIVLVSGGSVLFFKERLSRQQLIGGGLIVLGIVIYNL